MSVFLRDGEDVYRTYFTVGRGVEHLGSNWTFLDLTPLGRQEPGRTLRRAGRSPIPMSGGTTTTGSDNTGWAYARVPMGWRAWRVMQRTRRSS